jgi:Tol biopolymer transport system component
VQSLDQLALVLQRTRNAELTPDFTPDGKRIAFASNTAKEGSQEISLRTPMADRLTFNGGTNADPR